MRAWLTALRLARRELRRAKGRSALVVALIALPVLAFSFVAVSYDTFQLSPAERADRQMGRADLLVGAVYTEPLRQAPTELLPITRGEEKETTAADVQAVLPAGSRVIPFREGDLDVKTAGGVGSIPTMTLDIADPIATGIVTLLDGRTPAADGELAVTRAAATRLGVGIGGPVARADGTPLGRVVGLIETPDRITGETLVMRPTAVDSTTPDARTDWLVDTPSALTWPDVRQLNQKGVLALSRAVLVDPPAFDPATMAPVSDDADQGQKLLAAMLGAVLVLEVVLLVGPAFAVSARRRRRDLALVAAAGGSPAQLRRIVLADGVVLGAVAAACGLVTGVLLALAGKGFVADNIMHARPGTFRIFPEALAGLAGLAVGAGLVAALVPAIIAARQPVVAALAGRFVAGRLRRRWALLGLLMILGGAALATYATSATRTDLSVAGMVVAELGLVLCTPALVGLVARLAGGLPLGLRISLRDIGRNRASAAPAISAVLAAVAVGTLTAALMAGEDAKYNGEHVQHLVPTGYATASVEIGTTGPDEPPPAVPTAEQIAAVEAAMRSTLPATTVTRISQLTCAEGAAHGFRGACDLLVQRPEPTRCPYTRPFELSRWERIEAGKDERCASKVAYYSGGTFMTAVVEPAGVRGLLKLDPAELDAAEATLRAGGILLRDEFALDNGSVTMVVPDGSDQSYGGSPIGGAAPDTPGRRVVIPARLLPADADAPLMVLSPATAQRLGLGVSPAGLVAATSRVPSIAEGDALTAALAASGSWQVDVARPVAPSDNSLGLLLLAAAAGVVTIAAAAIAAGLAAAEGRADLVTLAAVGASPRIRRVLTLTRTGLIAGLGSTLGLLAGLGATLAIVTGEAAAAADQWPNVVLATPFVMPWPSVMVSLVVAPAVAMLGAALFTRARLPVERRTTG